MSERLQGYGDLHDIGGGGFSRVYRAADTRHSRTVAIKILDATELSDAERRAFERELSAMGRIGDHPHVVTVLDSGFTIDGQPFLVMPFYEDGTFSARMRATGGLPVEEAVDVGIKIACALETAHREGIIHRDVKPENIFVGEFGRHSLGDFGISSFADGEQGTRTVGIALTPAHSAPEVLEDEPPTTLTDVYSLGSTLYAFLSGRSAFGGDSLAALMRKVLTEDPPPLRRDDVPRSLDQLIRRMMAKQAGDRPQSALAVAEALRALQLDHGWKPTDITVRGWSSGSPESTFDPEVTQPRPHAGPDPAADDRTYVPSQLNPIVRPVEPSAAGPKPSSSEPEPPERFAAPTVPGTGGGTVTPDLEKTAFRSGLARPEPTRVEPDAAETVAPMEDDIEQKRSMVPILIGTIVILLAAGVAAALTRGGNETVAEDPADQVDQTPDLDSIGPTTLLSDPTELAFIDDSLTLTWNGPTGANIAYEVENVETDDIATTEQVEFDAATEFDLTALDGPLCVRVRAVSISPARVGEWVGPTCSGAA